jgi:hypothetical protein
MKKLLLTPRLYMGTRNYALARFVYIDGLGLAWMHQKLAWGKGMWPIEVVELGRC